MGWISLFGDDEEALRSLFDGPAAAPHTNNNNHQPQGSESEQYAGVSDLFNLTRTLSFSQFSFFKAKNDDAPWSIYQTLNMVTSSIQDSNSEQ